MFQGRIEQHASPEILYKQPATRNTAAFVGDANFIAMEKALVLFPELEKLDSHLKEACNVFMCRPEDVAVNRKGCHGKVIDTGFQGCWRELIINCTNNNCQAELMVRTDTATSWTDGDKLTALPLAGCIYSPAGQLLGTASLQED